MISLGSVVVMALVIAAALLNFIFNDEAGVPLTGRLSKGS
jgi:hypothetical protein